MVTLTSVLKRVEQFELALCGGATVSAASIPAIEVQSGGGSTASAASTLETDEVEAKSVGKENPPLMCVPCPDDAPAPVLARPRSEENRPVSSRPRSLPRSLSLSRGRGLFGSRRQRNYGTGATPAGGIDAARLHRVSDLLSQVYGPAADEKRGLVRAQKVMEKYEGEAWELEELLKAKLNDVRPREGAADDIAAITAGATAIGIIQANNEKNAKSKKKGGMLRGLKMMGSRVSGTRVEKVLSMELLLPAEEPPLKEGILLEKRHSSGGLIRVSLSTTNDASSHGGDSEDELRSTANDTRSVMSDELRSKFTVKSHLERTLSLSLSQDDEDSLFKFDEESEMSEKKSFVKSSN